MQFTLQLTLTLMKKSLLFGLIVSFTFFACSTDFDLTSDWKEIPVVYGLIDQSEDVQYFRINKAFLGDQDALVSASIADSLYFPEEMDVKLKAYKIERDNSGDPEFDPQGNTILAGNVVTTYNLERVSGYDEGLDKEEGTFQDDPFYVYKFDQFNQDGGDQFAYILEFETPTGSSISAKTQVINDFKVLLPNPENSFSLLLDDNNSTWLIKWRSADFAEVFDVSFRFNYSEAPINEIDNRVSKSILWTPIRNFDAQTASAGSSSNNYEKTINKADFYNFIAGRLGETSDHYRFLESIELVFDAATKDYKDFIAINSNSNGLNSNQIKAEFSNIDGGIGLFSSRYKKTVTYASFIGRDEFACEYAELAGLNFAPSIGQTSWPNCPE